MEHRPTLAPAGRTRMPARCLAAFSSLVAGLLLVACSAGATTSAPTETAMEHSPSPTAAVASPSASSAASPSAPAPVASGTFHAVDGTASGTAALFHLADGSFRVTFEDFAIDSAAGLHVILVPAKDITKSADVDRATLVDLGPLTGTSGMQDFSVPAAADAMTYHTVVLWDTEMGHAIAAAPLG